MIPIADQALDGPHFHLPRMRRAMLPHKQRGFGQAGGAGAQV
jgi:hypothetical protein